jgi:hypothetical protein
MDIGQSVSMYEGQSAESITLIGTVLRRNLK